MLDWIPLDIQMPEKGKEVLITVEDKYNSYVYSATYDGKRYFELDDEGRTVELKEVTAWMPMPVPYKERRKFKVGEHVIFGGEEYQIIDMSNTPYLKFDNGTMHYVMSIAKVNGTVDDWVIVNDAQVDKYKAGK